MFVDCQSIRRNQIGGYKVVFLFWKYLMWNGEVCELEICDIMKFATFHQLLRFWVGKQLKLIIQDDGLNKRCKCNVTVLNL